MTLNASISGLQQPVSSDTGVETLYVRDTGLDTNEGTLASPLLTIAEAQRRLKNKPSSGLRQRINVTGFSNLITEVLDLGLISATPRFRSWLSDVERPGGYDSGQFDIFDTPVEIYAEPQLVLSGFTVSGEVYEAESYRRTVTVTGATLVADAHVGQYLHNSVFRDSGGLIVSNTENTITLQCTASVRSGSWEIYQLGATLDFTGLAPSDGEHVKLAPKCSVALHGIEFLGLVAIESSQKVHAQFCAFPQGLRTRGDGATILQDCWINGSYEHTAGMVTQKYCHLDTCTTIEYTSEKGSSFQYSSVDASTTLKVWNGRLALDRATIWNATGTGLQGLAGSKLSLNYVRAYDCSLHGVALESGSGPHEMTNDLVGQRNVDAGLYLGVGVRLVGYDQDFLIQGDIGDLKFGRSVDDAYMSTSDPVAETINPRLLATHPLIMEGQQSVAKSNGIQPGVIITTTDYNTFDVGDPHPNTEVSQVGTRSNQITMGYLLCAAVDAAKVTVKTTDNNSVALGYAGCSAANRTDHPSAYANVSADGHSAFCHGYALQNAAANRNANIAATGDCSVARGKAEVHALGDANAWITADGIAAMVLAYAYARGAAGTGAAWADGDGAASLIHGYAYANNPLNTSATYLYTGSSAYGAYVAGFALDGASIYALGAGSHCQGQSSGDLSTIYTGSSGDGGFSHGYVDADGSIRVYQPGGFAKGRATAGFQVRVNNTAGEAHGYALGGSILVNGDAAYAGGYAEAFNIESNAAGAMAFGAADTAAIIANAKNAAQFGPGTNNTENSVQVGTGVLMKHNGQMATAPASLTLGVGATTFATTSNTMVITGDGGGNTIATITGGLEGQEMDLLFQDGLVTITDDDSATADSVSLSAAFTGAARTILTLKYINGKWYEKSRSVN